MLYLAFLLLAANPSPSDLVQQAIAIREEENKKDHKYTYREEVERRQLDKDGNSKIDSTETYDVIMLEGENYRKLILVDGKPLDAKRQKQVDADLEKTRAQRQKQRKRFTRSVRFGDLDELAKLFDLKLAGAETLDGRKTWRVEADPKPNYKAASKQEQDMLGTRRILWFDQETGLDVARKHQFLRSVNGFQPGSEMEMRFLPNGLIERLSLKYDVKAMAVMRARGETHHRFSNYQRFQAESKLLTQDEGRQN